MFTKYRKEIKQKIDQFNQQLNENLWRAKSEKKILETASAYGFIRWFYTFSHTQMYWLDMSKDFSDTFKPYKTSNHRIKDFLQLTSGIGNILTGVYAIISLSALIKGIQYAYSYDKASLGDYHVYLTYPLLSVLGPISQIIRGLTQVATYPLVLLFRIPMKTYLSKDKLSWDSFADRKSVKALVTKFDELIQNNSTDEEIKPIISELIRKVEASKGYEFQKNAPANKITISTRISHGTSPTIKSIRRLQPEDIQNEQTIKNHGFPVYKSDRSSNLLDKKELVKYVGLFRTGVDPKITNELPAIQSLAK